MHKVAAFIPSAILSMCLSTASISAAQNEGNGTKHYGLTECAVHELGRANSKGKAQNASSQFELAMDYLHSFCPENRIAIALDLMTKAALAGHQQAAYVLGKMYIDDQIVEQDLLVADRFLRIAADQGYIAAQHKLGLVILWQATNANTRNDGLRWLGIAAGQGDQLSALSLGFIHQKGMHGVSVDPCVALDWYKSAKLMGFADKGGLIAQLQGNLGNVC